ncbi:MAG: hypothetical protein ACI9LE_002217, partial [Paraglaciecola sp.]
CNFYFNAPDLSGPAGILDSNKDVVKENSDNAVKKK